MKEFDPDDPFELIGVELPAPSEESLKEMAATFAEEFARVGWDEYHILSLFTNPVYAAPHRAWQILGEDEIQRIVREAMDLWRPDFGGGQ